MDMGAPEKDLVDRIQVASYRLQVTGRWEGDQGLGISDQGSQSSIYNHQSSMIVRVVGGEAFGFGGCA